MRLSASLKAAFPILLLLASAAPAQDEARAPAAPAAAAPEGGAFPIKVVFTNLAGDPTAQVPGMPGVEFGPGTGTTHFDRPYGSPSGHWILSADTTLAITEDEVILVDGAVAAREGTAAAWTASELTGLIDTRLAINDGGDWTFATNTDGAATADEYIVQVTDGTFLAAAQEGQPVPGIAGATWGATLDSAVLANEGSAGFSSDTLLGVPTTEDEVLVLGAGVLAREGITIPAGQLGAEAWENFATEGLWISLDGGRWLADGDLAGDTATDGIVAVDGGVVVQEGVILAGSGFADAVDDNGVVGVHMDPAGNWFVRGNNDLTEDDWIYRNGAVLTTLGDAIYNGALETWTDAEFSDCFFFHVGSLNGDFVIGGVSDGATPANAVLVLNETHEVVREGDAFDLDGDGVFDDDTFFNTFGNDDGVLTAGAQLYFTATIRNGAGTVVGQGYFVADLRSVISAIFSDGFESGVPWRWSSFVAF